MKYWVASFLLILGSFSLFAQNLKVPTLSPRSEIKQEIGLTEIKISYSRPSAKGRTIFGDLVPYEKMWRTGANASTQLTFTEDVKVGGNPLTAGTYALYTIPGKENWTIIIHKNTKMRSIAGDRYKKEDDAFRFEVKSISNPLPVETFTIQFTDISTKGCQLMLSWENTVVKFPIEVEVDAKIETQMADLLKEPEKLSHRNYFRAAEYYLHNNKDLNTATEWIKTALEKSPKNFRYGLLHAKILAAQAKKGAAMKTIKEAHQWAVDRDNANYIEQTKLFMESLEKEGK